MHQGPFLIRFLKATLRQDDVEVEPRDDFPPDGDSLNFTNFSILASFTALTDSLYFFGGDVVVLFILQKLPGDHGEKTRQSWRSAADH